MPSSITRPVVPGGFIYQGDDLVAMQQLRTQIAVAERQQGNRLGDAAEDLPAMREQYDALVDEAAERAVQWSVTTISGTALRQMMGEHPPRTVEGSRDLLDDDAPFGVNVETFQRPFVAACLAEPTFADADAAAEWYDERTLAEQEQMFGLAWMLNVESGADPKASKFGTSGGSVLT